MSLEQQFEDFIRRIVREEVARAVDLSGDQLLTAEQTAELLGLADARAVYRLKREGKIEAVNLGEKTLRFRLAAVRQFIADRAA